LNKKPIIPNTHHTKLISNDLNPFCDFPEIEINYLSGFHLPVKKVSGQINLFRAGICIFSGFNAILFNQHLKPGK
jgi:hypothetical protein